MSAIYEAVFAVSLCATEKERKEHLVPIRVPLDNRLGQGKREIYIERERERTFLIRVNTLPLSPVDYFFVEEWRDSAIVRLSSERAAIPVKNVLRCVLIYVDAS